MKIRIGTRTSPLAMAQTYMYQKALNTAFPDAETEIVRFTTKGDKILSKPLDKIGGKGVFVGEIEDALCKGEIDAAVHSAKDLPAELAEGLEISGVLPRGNYRDMLITPKGRHFSANDIFTVGTGSQRRQINFSKIYPKAVFSGIRGNVDTRLKKLESGEYDGIILCAAGIERLGINLDGFETDIYNYDQFLPAPCQGIIAIECAVGSKAAELTAEISDRNTMLSFEAEREAVRLLGADCTVPVGVFSEVRDDDIFVRVSDRCVKYTEGRAAVKDRLKLVKELTAKL